MRVASESKQHIFLIYLFYQQSNKKKDSDNQRNIEYQIQQFARPCVIKQLLSTFNMILFKSFQVLVMTVTFIFTKLIFQRNIFTFTQM